MGIPNELKMYRMCLLEQRLGHTDAYSTCNTGQAAVHMVSLDILRIVFRTNNLRACAQ